MRLGDFRLFNLIRLLVRHLIRPVLKTVYRRIIRLDEVNQFSASSKTH